MREKQCHILETLEFIHFSRS